MDHRQNFGVGELSMPSISETQCEILHARRRPLGRAICSPPFIRLRAVRALLPNSFFCSVGLKIFQFWCSVRNITEYTLEMYEISPSPTGFIAPPFN